MKCVICKSTNIIKKEVEEDLRVGNDVAFVSVEALVCEECGERYYDRATIKKLEKVERDITNHKIKLKEIGHVLKTIS